MMSSTQQKLTQASNSEGILTITIQSKHAMQTPAPQVMCTVSQLSKTDMNEYRMSNKHEMESMLSQPQE